MLSWQSKDQRSEFTDSKCCLRGLYHSPPLKASIIGFLSLPKKISLSLSLSQSVSLSFSPIAYTIHIIHHSIYSLSGGFCGGETKSNLFAFLYKIWVS